MITSTVLMAGLITLCLLFIHKLNPLVTLITIHCLHLVLVEILLTQANSMNVNTEIIFVLCSGVTFAAGRLMVSMWSTLACETSTTDLRGTALAFLMISYQIGSSISHILNSFV